MDENKEMNPEVAAEEPAMDGAEVVETPTEVEEEAAPAEEMGNDEGAA